MLSIYRSRSCQLVQTSRCIWWARFINETRDNVGSNRTSAGVAMLRRLSDVIKLVNNMVMHAPNPRHCPHHRVSTNYGVLVLSQYRPTEGFKSRSPSDQDIGSFTTVQFCDLSPKDKHSMLRLSIPAKSSTCM